MQWYLYLIGILWIAYGCFTVLYTFEARQGLKLLVENLDNRVLGALAVVLGLLLAISAAWGAHAWFVRLIGLLAVIKGVLIILNPEKLWDKFIRWYIDRVDDRTNRVIGIVAIILGTALISWVG